MRDLLDALGYMRRKRIAALLACVLLLSGCEIYCGELVPRRETMHLFEVTTDGKGKVSEIENPRTGNRRVFYPPVSIDEAFPADVDVKPDNALASTNVTRATTLFAVADNRLSQFDIPSRAEVRSLATNVQLRNGIYSKSNAMIYLLSNTALNASTFSPSIQIVDATTFQIAGSIALPTTISPWNMALAAGGKYLYVAGGLTGQSFTDPVGVRIYVIDTATRTLLKTLRVESNTSINRPEVVASPDGALVFFTVGDGVAVVDVLTQTISHTILETSAGHIAVSPAGTALYAAPVFSGAQRGVAVYDIATASQVQFIPIPELSSTMAMAVSLDGQDLYLDHIVRDPATGRNDFPVVRVVDLGTAQILRTIPWTLDRETPYTVGRILVTPTP